MLDSGRAHRPPTRWEIFLVRRLLRSLGMPAIHVRLWDGQYVHGAQTRPQPGFTVDSRATLWRLLLSPDLGFGDDYAHGRIEVDGDLAALLEAVFRASPSGVRRRPLNLPGLRRLLHPLRSTRAAARHNIQHHYDLGNDFYRLWLDHELVYTCAYFPQPSLDLESAQRAKMDYVCRKLRLRPGERVIEAGCGWGALALLMARCYGVSVRAFNISRAQLEYARARAEREGLGRRVEFIEDDYRNIRGPCDAFVSVGMLEHVGVEHYPELGAVMHRCLAPRSGRGLIHSIAQNRPFPMNRWTERRLFPGAYPPTLREMMGLFEPFDFSVLDVENLRLHYALTLRHWLERFEGRRGDIEEMYGAPFVRAWRLYLAGSIANFSAGCLQLYQVLFARSADDNLPWSRAHLYASPDPEPEAGARSAPP